METYVHTKSYPLMPTAKLYSQQPKTGDNIHKLVQLCHGTLLGNKYEWTIDTHNNLAESQGNYAKWGEKTQSSKLHRKQVLAKLPQAPEGPCLRGNRHATWPAALHCQAGHSQSQVFISQMKAGRWHLWKEAGRAWWAPIHRFLPHMCNETRWVKQFPNS